MDALLLHAVLRELRATLLDAVVNRVDLVGEYAVLLRLDRRGCDLFLSAHPELSRLSLVAEPPDVGEPRPAPDNLAEPLLRARLAGVDAEPYGRVAALRFERPDGRHAAPRLVAEMIPRFANLLLVGNDERILWSKREFGPGHVREVAPGRTYAAPADAAGVPLPDVDADLLAARLAEREGPLHLRIPRGWGGGSAGFARVLEETGVDFPGRLLALAEAARDPQPRLARRAGGPDEIVLFPADPGEVPGWEILPPLSPNGTADRLYRPREEADAASALLSELSRTLAKRRTRAAKALIHVERRLADADLADAVREQAEILAAHQGEVRRGMERAVFPSFDGAREVAVPLDPKLDPAGNVEALFRRARRLARGRDELLAQRAMLEADIAAADRGLAALDPPPRLAALRELAREHAPALLDPRGPRGATGAPAGRPDAPERPSSLPEGFNPRRYVLRGGWEVWVGRNAKQNDELTHRRAAQRDLWFHARGCEGSHTVLRIGSGKGEPPREIVEQVAAIAAFHSKARNSKLVPVAYTERRHVRKPRGAPVGTASIQREKVIFVEPREPAEVGSADPEAS